MVQQCGVKQMVLSLEQLQWLAGIIDSEGSITLRNSFFHDNRKSGKMKASRNGRITIATCDNVIVPFISELVGINYKILNRKTAAGNSIYSIIIGDKKTLKDLLPKIIPYMFTKQPHARILLKSLFLPSGRFYTDEESIMHKELTNKIRILNSRGYGIQDELESRDHLFTYSWFAGVIDGDGCVSAGEWKIKSRNGIQRSVLKPYLKISLSHIKTVEYLSFVLQTGILKSGRELSCRTNRRKTRAIRLMPEKLMIWLPRVMPHLRLKRNQAELALQLSKLKSDYKNHKIVLSDEYKSEVCRMYNAIKSLNRGKKNDQQVC